jgi:predicted esterase
MRTAFYRFRFIYSGLLLLTILSSCSSDHSGQKKIQEPVSPVAPVQSRDDFSGMAGKITDNIQYSGQPQLSYCLYLPSGYSAQKKFPVIFIFDAHADGKLPVEKYHALAEEFGFVLIGSNNSRNGLAYDSLVGMATALIQDASSKISVDATRRYTMGFSGGARVAGVVAASAQNIAGVIGCGAAYMDENFKSRPELFFFRFARNDDFNLLEMSRMHEHFKQAGVKNYFQVFEGKHEWPDSATMRNAFEILTVTDARQMAALEKKISAAGVSPRVAKGFEAEAEQQKKYIDAFTSQNIFWWKNEISGLQQCGNMKADVEKLHRCKRLLAYIGVAVYSFSTNAIKSHNDADAEKLLQIYLMADSQNSEQRFLEAILRARQGDNNRALALLNEAVSLGFSDFARIESEPDFQKLKSMDGYSRLITKDKTQNP